MKRPAPTFAAALALVLILSGCGTDETTTHTMDNPAAASQTPKLSSRGNIVKKVGEEAGITGEDGKDVADWTVTGINPNPTCSNPANQQPEHGHFIEFDITATTTENYDPMKYGSLDVGTAYRWQFIQKDGTQWNGMPGSTAAESCMTQTDKLPDSLNQGAKAQGKVIFDVPSLEGTLYYPQMGKAEGWEYPLQ